MRRLRSLVLLAGLVAATPAVAVQPDEVLGDPTLESRARDLSRELRCMVCQNQSIDDSDAPLARDLRVLVRERLKAGDSDKEVIDFLTARYGDFVLLKPRFTESTALLWLMPVVFAVIGVLSLVRFMRRRPREIEAAAPQLTPEERAKLAEVVSRGE